MIASIRLHIEDVGKVYGARRVLNNIAADLAQGDVLLVTGHNGIGKSTLLRLLAGLQQPSSGSIEYVVDQQHLAPYEARDLIGFVGPDVQLYRELTAREHLEFVADVRGLPLNQIRSAAVLAAVGLAGRDDELVAGFSSGMQQRLRYAIAALHRPPVLLLDEPTTNLDVAGIALVDGIVDEQTRRGITVIATNDPRDRRYGTLELALGEQP